MTGSRPRSGACITAVRVTVSASAGAAPNAMRTPIAAAHTVRLRAKNEANTTRAPSQSGRHAESAAAWKAPRRHLAAKWTIGDNCQYGKAALMLKVGAHVDCCDAQLGCCAALLLTVPAGKSLGSRKRRFDRQALRIRRPIDRASFRYRAFTLRRYTKFPGALFGKHGHSRLCSSNGLRGKTLKIASREAWQPAGHRVVI